MLQSSSLPFFRTTNGEISRTPPTLSLRLHRLIHHTVMLRHGTGPLADRAPIPHSHSSSPQLVVTLLATEPPRQPQNLPHHPHLSLLQFPPAQSTPQGPLHHLLLGLNHKDGTEVATIGSSLVQFRNRNPHRPHRRLGPVTHSQTYSRATGRPPSPFDLQSSSISVHQIKDGRCCKTRGGPRAKVSAPEVNAMTHTPKKRLYRRKRKKGRRR